MLERIHQITSVGLFQDIRPAGMSFKKMTFVYADNGRGKSTLASILRSYTELNPDIVRTGKRLGKRPLKIFICSFRREIVRFTITIHGMVSIQMCTSST